MDLQNKPQIDKTLLFETIYTKEDLLLFYKEIDQLVALIFTGSDSVEQKMDKLISKDKKKSLLHYFKTANVRTDNPVEVNQALSKIQALGNSLPVVSLELAIEPTEETIKAISFWFIRRLQTKVILDITLERRIIGGAYIAFNGTYRDYSLQTKIDKYFGKSSQLVSSHITENPINASTVNREP